MILFKHLDCSPCYQNAWRWLDTSVSADPVAAHQPIQTLLMFQPWPRPQITMNYLRRRLSDSSFVANLPNGYVTELRRPAAPSSPSSSPASPATERRAQQHSAPASSSASASSSSNFLSSFSSVVRSGPAASLGQAEPARSVHGPAPASAPSLTSSTGPTPSLPVVPKPKVLLVIGDFHTDW